MSCKMCWRGWTELSRRSSAASARAEARLSTLPGRNRYNSLHLQGVRQRGAPGQRLPGPLQDRAYRRALVPPIEGTPKTVTISREADGWYVCFSCADVPVQPLPPTGQETGIDLGIEAFATLSDGTRIFSPGWYRKAERALKTAQRRVSAARRGATAGARRSRCSPRRIRRCAASGRTFTTRRRSRWCEHNDTIYHEDLQTANMLRNHHLAKSISDAGWAQFLSILAFKAACAGKRVVAVPPAYTSQTCSGCGVVVSKGLSVRWHGCPDCGTSLHRDHNAAKNIERAGQALRGARGVGCVGEPRISRIYAGECQWYVVTRKRALEREQAEAL